VTPRPRELVRDVLQTVFRLVPWPTEPGLRRSGNPGDLSPVLVTSNYDLTVRRLVRALGGLDAWIVVAPAGGINVWCASSGGHLGTHQVVTALKTSGVAARVRHRRAILPQLSATGVQAREVSRRTGWRVHFGPVDARDLPRYLAAGGEKTDAMRRVRFGARERLEMATAWGGPAALVLGLAAAALRPGWLAAAVVLPIVLAVAVFAVYDRLPAPRRAWFGAGAVAFAAVLAALGGAAPGAIGAAALAGAGLAALLTFDYEGSTPIEGGSFFEERAWHVTLDLERCAGVFQCVAVCPEACFERQMEPRKAVFAHDDRCVRCGACIVQCPMDALAFEDAEGRRVEPETIRRYKLNLLGRRTRASGEAGTSPL